MLSTTYKNSQILPCFFHFCQALWRKANKLRLRRSKYISLAKDMILNLKVLAFTKIEDVVKRFENIKRYFTRLGENFEEFIAYFDNNWIKGKKINIKHWNYSMAVI